MGTVADHSIAILATQVGASAVVRDAVRKLGAGKLKGRAVKVKTL